MSTGAPGETRSIEHEANLLARLDRAPMTKTIKIIIFLLMLVWLVEAFDIGIIGTALLFLKKAWALTPKQVGLLGSAGTFGIVLGLLPAGRIADRFGRKKVLIVGIAIFSVFSFAGVLAANISQLAILRFIAGLGEGAVFPAPYLLIAEFVNKKHRGVAVGWANFVLTGAYMFPSLAGVWVLRFSSPDTGWRILFLMGGVCIILVPILIKWLPESPRFLLKAGRENVVQALVEQVEDEAHLPHDTALVNQQSLDVLKATEHRNVGLGTLLQSPYLKRAFVSYCALGSPFVIFYTMTIYGPTIFHLMGQTASNALLYTAALQLLSGFGTVFGAALGDRFGRRPIHSIFMLITALALILLGQSFATPVLVLLAVVAWFLGLGGFAVPKLYMAEQFPTRLRATGSAAGEVITRFLLGVVMVYYIPTMLAVMHPSGLFILLGIAMVALVLPLIFLGNETAGRSVEETGTRVAGTAKPG